MSWIAAETAETTQAAARQPTCVDTIDIRTLRHAQSVLENTSQFVINQRLIRRMTHGTSEAQSPGAAKSEDAQELTVHLRALQTVSSALVNQISDSHGPTPGPRRTISRYTAIQDDLRGKDGIAAAITGGLELDQLQVELQTHVGAGLLPRQQEVDAQRLHGSGHQRNSPDVRQGVARSTTAGCKWKEMIHEEDKDDRSTQALQRVPQQRQVDADKVVGLDVVAGDTAEVGLADDDDRPEENVRQHKHVELVEEVVRQLAGGGGGRSLAL